MKILHLATHLNIGGISRYVTNLVKFLKKRGHTLFVASSGGELEGSLSSAGVRHIYLDIKTKSELSPKVIKSFFALKPFLKKEKVDLIHAHTRVTQVTAALLSRYFKIPYVTTCHGFFKRRLGRRICGCWGEKVIAISEAVKDQLINDFKVEEERVALVHTGIEIEKFSRDFSDKEKKEARRKWNLNEAPVLGAIGRLSSVKGQEVLIKAAKILIREFPDVKILLIGDGPDEGRLRKLSRDLELRKNVVFGGSLRDTREALAAIDIFVLPSIAEGLGLSLVEAMACGKLCIASRIGGIGSLIKDGVTGMLFEPGNPEDLTRAARYMLQNKDKVENFKEEARKKAVSDFNIEETACRIEKMYSDVLKSARKTYRR